MTARHGEISVVDLAVTAKATAQLLLALEYGGRMVRVPPPPEVRSASWALLYWSMDLAAAARA